MTKHVAIIGAGPVGLEAALFAARHDCPVTVFERGRVAESVRRWGHVRLFSPFGTNASPWGRAVLAESAVELPRDEELLTGRDFANRYLTPLAEAPLLRGRLRDETEVVSIGRPHHGKRDAIGKPERAAHGFRLLVRDRDGERVEVADVVLDCSGTFPQHRWLGAGGTPAVGERSCTAIRYDLPDVLGAERNRFARKRTLVVGSGYSAATAIAALGALAKAVPETSAVWITRDRGTLPVARIPGDALPERDRLAGEANRLAAEQGGAVDWWPGANVEAVTAERDGRITVATSDRGTHAFDSVIANVGYKPDRSLYEELQVHECYASQGPIKLGATLLGETSVDCLAQASPGAETLVNPEPGFFVLGSKSYGRDSRFLMRTGLEQIRQVMSLIGVGCEQPSPASV